MRIYVLFGIALLTAGLLQAQPRWETGVFLGLSNYQGDFVQETFPLFKEGNLGLGLKGKYNLSYTLSIGANIMFGRLTGDDFNYPDRRDRGFLFKTPLTELSFALEWEPLGRQRYFSGSRFQGIFTPYFFAGAGLVFTDPKPDFSRNTNPGMQQRILRDQNASYLKARLMVPFGVGVRIDLDEQWALGLEVGMRTPFYDYLDGVSISGNSDENDWYQFSGVVLMYRLPGSVIGKR